MRRSLAVLVSAAIALAIPAVQSAAAAHPPPASSDARVANGIDGASQQTAPSPRSIESACTFQGDFEDGFADVPSSNPHERAVDCIVYWQVTTGVRPGVYDPASGVTRGQMASFLARFVENSGGTLPSNPPDAFPDDNGTTHETNINKLAAAKIAGGRADGTYDPDGSVLRSQMATFIVRALEFRLDGPVNNGEPAPNYFSDDEGDTHEANINKAAAIGITGGTAGTNYSPKMPVRRDQMASFLARGLAELVDKGGARIPGPPPKCSHNSSLERTDSNCKAPSPPPTQPAPPTGCSASGSKYEPANGGCIDRYDANGNGDINCTELPTAAKPIRVKTPGDDPYDLDSDGDGVGCER